MGGDVRAHDSDRGGKHEESGEHRIPKRTIGTHGVRFLLPQHKDARATSAGVKKIPLPMMPPTTINVLEARPRSRRREPGIGNGESGIGLGLVIAHPLRFLDFGLSCGCAMRRAQTIIMSR